MQFFFINESIMVDVNFMENFGFCHSAVLNGDTEIIDDLLGWYFFFVYGAFEFGM